MFAGRLQLPPPSLLVVAGLLIGLLPGVPAVRVPPEVVSLVVLPPLLYAASEELPWRDLRAVWRPVIILAVGLVLASAAAVAAVAVRWRPSRRAWRSCSARCWPARTRSRSARWGGGCPCHPGSRRWSRPRACSTTRPAWCSSRSRYPSRSQERPRTSAGGLLLHGAGQFVVLAAGGAAVGGAVAVGVIAVRRHVTDPVLDTVMALITPYAAYVLGATLHVSPVLAVIVAGLAIGARRAKITTAQTRLQLHSVYQTVIFLLESVVFSLIGLQLPTLIRALSHAEAWPAEALAVAGTLIAIRILWVFPLSAIIQRRSGARRPSLAIPAVVSWAGTRGVVPLAAALSIPLTSASGAPLAQRDLVLVLAAAVIVVSLIVQGLTLEPLARFAGITRPADARHEETVARLRLAEAALARLDELADDNAAPDAVIDRARASLQARIGQTRARADGTRAPGPDGLTERELRRDLIGAENAELARLYENGIISAATRQRLQHNLDLEATRLSDDQR